MKLLEQGFMFTRYLTIILVSVFSTTAYAEEKQPIDLDDPKPLIMQPGYHLKNGYTDETTPDAFKTNGDAGDALTEHCKMLRETEDRLRRQGKFQQRWAVRERYQYECQSVFDRSPD